METNRTGITFALLLATAVAYGAAGDLNAQEPAAFDLDRVLLYDMTRFLPFNVSETRALRDALDDGTIHEDTPLLVLEGRSGALALLVEQMAYHHVAQGELAGEPWMVSF
jgi:hypothetical protein